MVTFIIIRLRINVHDGEKSFLIKLMSVPKYHNNYNRFVN